MEHCTVECGGQQYADHAVRAKKGFASSAPASFCFFAKTNHKIPEMITTEMITIRLVRPPVLNMIRFADRDPTGFCNSEPDRDPTGFCNSEPDPGWTAFLKNLTWSDMDIQLHWSLQINAHSEVFSDIYQIGSNFRTSLPDLDQTELLNENFGLHQDWKNLWFFNTSVRRNLTRVGKVEILLMPVLFRLLTMQRKWTYTNRFTLSTPQRKHLKLQQQLQTGFSL